LIFPSDAPGIVQNSESYICEWKALNVLLDISNWAGSRTLDSCTYCDNRWYSNPVIHAADETSNSVLSPWLCTPSERQ
jgi:hypothetical protein